MRLFPVLAERFAVVADDDASVWSRRPSRLERVEEPADLDVGGGDLGVIGALERLRKARAERRRREVRRVWIVEVDPREETAGPCPRRARPARDRPRRVPDR